MHQRYRSNTCAARAVLSSALGILCGLMLAAPVLASLSFHRAAAIIYFCFAPICHQIPERSFALFGAPLAVCHRCAGIYLGMLLGSFINNRAMHRSAKTRRFWVLSGIVPLLLDVIAPVAGLWSGTGCTRFSTGLLFGIVISSLLVRGVEEFVQESPWRRLAPRTSQLKGGLS